jgi:hypothetical protein
MSINNIGSSKVGGAGPIGGPSSIKPADTTAKGIETLKGIEASAIKGDSGSANAIKAVAEIVFGLS